LSHFGSSADHEDQKRRCIEASASCFGLK